MKKCQICQVEARYSVCYRADCKAEYHRRLYIEYKAKAGKPSANPEYNNWIKVNGYRVRQAKNESCCKCTKSLLTGTDYIYELNEGVASGIMCEPCWETNAQ